MNVELNFMLFIFGLAILLKGADWFTGNAAQIARQIGVSEFVIGLTLVAFATSLPELAISVTAAAANFTEIAIGNVIGSNIANIGLVLGLATLMAPIAISKRDVSEGTIMVFLLIVGSIFCLNGLTRLEGIILVGFLLIYIWSTFKEGFPKIEPRASQTLAKNTFFLIVGVIGVVLGSRIVVDSAVNIANWFGISAAIVAMTIIAVGTSLPELATSIVAATKGLKEIALGNIIGSNIFNIAAVLGISAIVSKIPITEQLIWLNVSIMLVLSAILLIVMKSGKQITRKEGLGFLVIYIIFLGLQLYRF